MTWLGNFAATSVSVQHKFMTVNASGKPTTLGDSPSLVLYVNATTTGIASGVSGTFDFDGRTGLNHVRALITTSVTGITSGTECQLVIATGSVSGVSLNGYPVCEFSLMNRPVQGIATIAPARVTAQGIDVGAIVTAVNTIIPARLTAQGIDVGAIVTAISTIAPARVTAQGIDVGAIVTAVNTIVPARVTALAAGIITSAAFAANAIDAAALAADAVTEIQSGLAESTALAVVQTDVDNIQTRLPTALSGGRMISDAQAFGSVTVVGSGTSAELWRGAA